jgi:hypothetical protein
VPYGYYGARWGWGVPWYGAYWPYGWWFGPAYLVGPENPYGPSYDPRNFDQFGPQQIFMASLRDAELQPHERMGGLVYFAPAWHSRLLTLRFEARPEGGRPVELATRFEVTR